VASGGEEGTRPALAFNSRQAHGRVSKKGRKKLIEVALPLGSILSVQERKRLGLGAARVGGINDASARETSIRHGHPSTLHLWWARRPLATARAVIFAQMVDDPSSLPDLFPPALWACPVREWW